MILNFKAYAYDLDSASMNNSCVPIVKTTTVEMILPHDVIFILLRLIKKGYDAYVVGGCVRDTICNQLFETNYPIHDYDITTNATPEQIMEVFNDYKVIPTGLKHGTVTILLNNKTYEITTYRKESGYSDHRHADRIEFVDTLKEDLSRRDLTINAIAYNPLEGFVDPFNGALDIYNKTIRCVGNPNERLQEDALRILRVLRFASNRGFTIEEETEKAICNPDNYRWLKTISRERITDELRKMLNVNPCLIDIPEKVNYLINKIHYEYLEIFNTILPGFYLIYAYNASSKHTYMLEHNLATLFNLRKTFSSDYSFSTCMVALFHDLGKHFAKRIYDEYHDAYDFPNLGEKSVELFRRSVLPCLRLSNKEIKEIELLILHYDDIIVCNKQAITEKLIELGSLETFKQLYQLQVADYLDNLYSSNNTEEYLTYLENSYKLACELVNNKEVCFQIKDLNISGDDIINLLHIEAGPLVGTILNKLLEEVVAEKLQNNKEELTKYVLDNFNKK